MISCEGRPLHRPVIVEKKCMIHRTCSRLPFRRGHHVRVQTNNSPFRTRLSYRAQALAFAVDQASFACGAVSQTQPPGTRIRGSVASADSVATATTAAVSAPAEVVRPGVNKHGNASGNSRVWLAVRAALQFACNYCVGNEENQALLWVKWFPRGFMVRASVRACVVSGCFASWQEESVFCFSLKHASPTVMIVIM